MFESEDHAMEEDTDTVAEVKALKVSRLSRAAV